jgi:Tfp pilus assembly protein PilF
MQAKGLTISCLWFVAYFLLCTMLWGLLGGCSREENAPDEEPESAMADNSYYTWVPIRRGDSLYKRGDYEGSMQQYRKALTSDPDLPLVYARMGFVWHTIGELDSAAWAYRRALELDTNQIAAQYYLGMVYSRLDSIQHAIRAYEMVLRRSRRYPGAHFLLAEAYERKGERRKAIQHYRRYLRLVPEGNRSLEALEALTRLTQRGG